MRAHEVGRSGWRGVALVAITYVYFLIFAQFAFLNRLAQLNIADAHLKAVMAAMALGGILFSLLTPRLTLYPSPSTRLRFALAVCAATASLTLLPLTLPASIIVSFLIGSGLGVLTVTLVTHLRTWLGAGNALFKVGLGTGLGYLVCNFPPLFTASPQTQAVTAAMLCLAGIVVAWKTIPEDPATEPTPPQPPISFPRVLLCFTALVWLDSAAFFIIQSTPLLKTGTWEGAAHLWVNGALHLTAALASAWLLLKRGLGFVLSAALLALAAACLLLLDPNRALLASIFYPIGVSLYSVALVAYPSLLATASSIDTRARNAGMIYAVAGWLGSAMGIGMGQHLGRVPPAFVLLASTAVLLPQAFTLLRHRRRELLATTGVLLLAFVLHRAIVAHTPDQPATTSIARGHQVYIAEGCINCHSQYVRPHSPDDTMWGPVQTLDELRRQRPPLIGNRRQGPDLSEVGGRRSTLWMKAHFDSPSEVVHSSFMPRYAYLFQNGTRGDDLIAYLQSLQSAGTPQHRLAERTWQPAPAAWANSKPGDGAALFQTYCSTCHMVDGRTRLAWKSSFHRLPPNLATDSLLHVSSSEPPRQLQLHLAQIVKFGIAGTDMAGHEYMPDKDIAALALWLQQTIAHPAPPPISNRLPGGTP